jgi:hypothetical protein
VPAILQLVLLLFLIHYRRRFMSEVLGKKSNI